MENISEEQLIVREKTELSLTQKLLIGLLILVTLIGVIEYMQYTKEAKPKKFVYCIKFFPDSDATAQTKMDGLGLDGWQVVSARRANDGDNNSFGYEFVYMKEAE